MQSAGREAAPRRAAAGAWPTGHRLRGCRRSCVVTRPRVRTGDHRGGKHSDGPCSTALLLDRPLRHPVDTDDEWDLHGGPRRPSTRPLIPQVGEQRGARRRTDVLHIDRELESGSRSVGVSSQADIATGSPPGVPSSAVMGRRFTRRNPTQSKWHVMAAAGDSHWQEARGAPWTAGFL